MKKNIYFLLAIMIMAMVSVEFTACSVDDDDDDKSINSNPGGEDDSETFTMTMDGETLYEYKQTGVASNNLLAFISNHEETPSKAFFMDAEDWDSSSYWYELQLCFSRFSLTEDVGKELKLCPVSWKATSGYGSWEFENSFAYVKTVRDGKADVFSYVSGRITFHSLNVQKGKLQIKYDNVVFECEKHENSNMKRDKVVLNGICTYTYYSVK